MVSNLCGLTSSSAATLTLHLGLLAVTSVSNSVINLSWAGAPAVHLQSTTNLDSPTVWADVPDTAGTNAAALPITGARMFFRLASP